MAAHRARHACVSLALALVCAALLPAAASAGRGDKTAANEAVAGRYIVVFDAGVASAAAETAQRESRLGFTARREYRRVLEGFAARLTPEQVGALRRDPEVDFVSPDRPVRALGAVPLIAGEQTPAGVRRINGAAAGWAREASGVGVAIVDSGIDLSHPDLNAVDGINCITPGAPATDDNGHGTHVAGTVGARNTGAGVVGVAPGTRLYAVKVLDAEGEGSWSSIICGLDWITANAAALDIEVANLSLGGGGTNDRACGTTNGDALHAAICRVTRAGVLNVVAAGNSGWNLGDAPPDVPASYPEVLTVTAFGDTDGRSGGLGVAPPCAASEADDRFASFSNYATRPADTAHMVAAPGVCVVSTWPGGGHASLSGTSMAAPHVAGLAALCIAEGGEAGPCAGKSPAGVLAQIRSDAQAAAIVTPAYGFAGDPLRVNQWGDYFGYAVRALDDRTAPDTRLVAAPPALTNARTPRFEFGAAAATRFECRLDGGAWSACASPSTTSPLADGTHLYEVRAADVVGNVEAAPATASFTVDTVAPRAAIATGPAEATKNRTPTFEFAADPGAAVECRVDAGVWTACTSPHRTPELADGPHAFEVRARDAAGNESVARWAFTIDTTILTPPTASQPVAAPPVTAPTDRAAPRLVVAFGSRSLRVVRASGLRAYVTVSERAALSGRLVLDGRTARRLGLSRGAAVAVGRGSLAAGTGRRTLVLRLNAAAKARLARVSSVPLSLRLRAADLAGNAASTTRRVVLGR